LKQGPRACTSGLTKQATFMAHAYAKTARELFDGPRIDPPK
jgi:hypothetical protein